MNQYICNIQGSVKFGSVYIFCISVLLNFLEKNARRPLVKTAKQDTQELLSAKQEVLEKIGVTTEQISDDFAT